MPDLHMDVEWSQLGSDEDIILLEATAWLESQPACEK